VEVGREFPNDEVFRQFFVPSVIGLSTDNALRDSVIPSAINLLSSRLLEIRGCRVRTKEEGEE